MKQMLSRRDFLARSCPLAGAAAGLGMGTALSFGRTATEPRRFRLWVISDAHVGTDLRRKRESLADAIRQSEFGGDLGGPPFEWDIAVHLGDLSGNQSSPDDDEGREVVRQLAATRKHRREDFYHLAGNHDASGPGEPTQWWFRKWVDPLGEQPATSGVRKDRRPSPITGTWERYQFRVGNIVFLMMSDRNDVGPPVGRGERGGYPAGAVTSATWQWWREQVAKADDRIVISAHHHMLRETTVASGPWEGFRRRADGSYVSHYHGYFPDGGPKGASYLYWLDEKPDAGAFESYLAAHQPAIDLWIGGHTHTHPDDRTGGRGHIERKWGVTFLNAAGLTRYHGRQSMPMSRLLTFTEGSAELRIQCYLHTSQHAPQGWYAPAERTVPLRRPFRFL